MAFSGAERRSGEVVGEVRREVAQLGGAEEVRLETRLLLDLLLLREEAELLVRLADHQPAGHVDVERPVELRFERLPDARRLAEEPHLVEQAAANARRLERGEVVDRDLEMEAPRVRPRRLAVQLAALRHDDVDPLARKVVRERDAGEASADDEDVGLGGERGGRHGAQ